MNASWNGRHDRLAGLSASLTASRRPKSASRASGFDSDGMDALFPHGLVSEPERVESVGVAAHNLDPNRDSLRGLLSLSDDLPHRHLVSAEPGRRGR